MLQRVRRRAPGVGEQLVDGALLSRQLALERLSLVLQRRRDAGWVSQEAGQQWRLLSFRNLLSVSNEPR
jgi:hypothetical protein